MQKFLSLSTVVHKLCPMHFGPNHETQDPAMRHRNLTANHNIPYKCTASVLQINEGNTRHNTQELGWAHLHGQHPQSALLITTLSRIHSLTSQLPEAVISLCFIWIKRFFLLHKVSIFENSFSKCAQSLSNILSNLHTKCGGCFSAERCRKKSFSLLCFLRCLVMTWMKIFILFDSSFFAA